MKKTKENLESDLIKLYDKGGSGKIRVGTKAMKIIIFEILLDTPCGAIKNKKFKFSGFPKKCIALEEGLAKEAKITNGDGEDVLCGLIVDEKKSENYKDIALDSTNISKGQEINISYASIVIT